MFTSEKSFDFAIGSRGQSLTADPRRRQSVWGWFRIPAPSEDANSIRSSLLVPAKIQRCVCEHMNKTERMEAARLLLSGRVTYLRVVELTLLRVDEVEAVVDDYNLHPECMDSPEEGRGRTLSGDELAILLGAMRVL